MTVFLQVLGGVNESMYEGDIFSTSIVEEKFYNIIVTNLTVGDTTINMDCKEVRKCHVIGTCYCLIAHWEWYLLRL